MKFPCVELYFEIESGPLDIRIWMKTEDKLANGELPVDCYIGMSEIKSGILARKCMDRADMVKHLSSVSAISAFQVSYRHDLNRMGIVVYKEWP